jgi:hypothetical protein
MTPAVPLTICPLCAAPINPARRGNQFTWLDKDGRGAGFSDTVEQPASCTNPDCDWEDRPGPTFPG